MDVAGDLEVFTVVGDAGSFSAAGRRLNRAQSVISYAVAQLEEQLGVALFDRAGRMPQLTEAGRALLADARRATASVDALRARAAALQQGIEAELRVGIDVMVPVTTVVHVLDAFASMFPTVGLRLCMEALGGIAELVMADACDFGISTELTAMPDVIRSQPIGSVRLVPVAAPHHALAQSDAPAGREAVRDATQIVLSDRSVLTRGQDIAVLSLRTWRVGDLGAKHALLRAGLGWGNMPALMVAEDLTSGRLVQLDLSEGRSHDYPLGLIQRGDRLLGPAAGWLAAELVRALSRVALEPEHYKVEKT